MADDAERMAALKRAYADIILNTAKESAARILASERKVRQLQRSLSLTKEDSLAMLLRLKAIMDSKRKRKRGSLDGKVEPTFIKENMSKRKVDKDDSELEPQESSIVVESSRPEPQKSSLVVESSRDSRRLAQVARQ
ncbi:Potassium transporter, partial [Musa troglodytarum]